MSNHKHKKQFGIWMDHYHATLVGREDLHDGPFKVIGHYKSEHSARNSNEHAAHNQERQLLHKFYKEICHHMPNVDELHIVGPGNAQEQFMHYLRDTPQYKNTHCTEGTASKISDDKLIELIEQKFGH